MDIENKPYIRIAEVDDEEPSKDDLGLDFNVDMEYNTPYTTYGEELITGLGGAIEAGGIFDDR